MLFAFTGLLTKASDTLTVRQVYNFNVGDTFDYRRTYIDAYIGMNEITYERRVVSQKFIGADTITYFFLNGGVEIYSGLDSIAFIPVYNSYGACIKTLLFDTTTYTSHISNAVHWDCFEAFKLKRLTENLGITYDGTSGMYDGQYPMDDAVELVYYSNGLTHLGTPMEILASASDLKNNAPVISLYPTLITTQLNIDLNEPKQAQYHVYNTVGQLLLQGQLEAPKTVLDISRLANGVYMLQVQIDGRVETKRFVVQH